MIRTILAATVAAVALTVAPAVAGQPTRDIPVSCVEHVDASGNGSIGHCHSGRDVQRMDVPRWMTRPCAEEDSVNCYWDAHTRGNGQGHSFYVRRMPYDITGLTCWTYTAPRYARNHDHCEVTR